VLHPVRCRQCPPAPRLLQLNRSIRKIAGYLRGQSVKLEFERRSAYDVGVHPSKGRSLGPAEAGFAQVRFVATEGPTMARRKRNRVSGPVLIIGADEAYQAVIETCVRLAGCPNSKSLEVLAALGDGPLASCDGSQQLPRDRGIHERDRYQAIVTRSKTQSRRSIWTARTLGLSPRTCGPVAGLSGDRRLKRTIWSRSRSTASGCTCPQTSTS
jgi:hypothetical protein